MYHECASCGAVYGGSLQHDWGRTRETDGLGPQQRCAALVEDPHAPTAADGSQPLQYCGGMLGAVAETTARGERLVVLTPIGDVGR